MMLFSLTLFFDAAADFTPVYALPRYAMRDMLLIFCHAAMPYMPRVAAALPHFLRCRYATLVCHAFHAITLRRYFALRHDAADSCFAVAALCHALLRLPPTRFDATLLIAIRVRPPCAFDDASYAC